MQGRVPPKIAERMQCKHLLERLGFRLEAALAIVHNHSNNYQGSCCVSRQITLTSYLRPFAPTAESMNTGHEIQVQYVTHGATSVDTSVLHPLSQDPL